MVGALKHSEGFVQLLHKYKILIVLLFRKLNLIYYKTSVIHQSYDERKKI